MPEATLTPEIHLACERSNWDALVARLRADAPNEACAFVLTRPSRGSQRTTLILREIVWPNPGDVEASPGSLEISADYITRAMDAAVDAGDMVGLTLVHTHPDTEYGTGRGVFSARDDWYEARLFPTITLQRASAVSASVVLGGADKDLDARIWWTRGGHLSTQRVHVVRVVGPEVTFMETAHSDWADHPDPEVMDRSTRLWGIQGRRVLQNLRVGVVGAGGTGSVALLSLATMGVGRLRIWDMDTLKKLNRHRTLGSTEAMVGQNKAEALAPAIRKAATASPFDLISTPTCGTSATSLRDMKDCDVVFCCVDRLAPRVPLNDLAYAHLIPIVDIASWIHTSGEIVDSIVTHAHVWSPGVPCAWCRQTLTARALTREAQGVQRDAEHRVPYGMPLAQTDGEEPSVLPLNVTGVGLALLEFLQVALRISTRTPRDLKLFLPQWELDESDLDRATDCGTEGDTALGDAVVIRPVECSADHETALP